MKDIKIGTKITFEGHVLVVEQAKGNNPICTGCYFSDSVRRRLYHKSKYSCYVHNMACTPPNRKDKKHVIFKPV